MTDATTARTIADTAAARTAEALRAGRLTEEEYALRCRDAGCSSRPHFHTPAVEAILAARAQPQDALAAAVEALVWSDDAKRWRDQAARGTAEMPYAANRYVILVDALRAALAGSGAEVGREAAVKAWDEGLSAGRDRWADSREFGEPPVNPYRAEFAAPAPPTVVCPHDPPCQRLDNGWPACATPSPSEDGA